MRNIVFEPQAFQDFNNWAREDRINEGAVIIISCKFHYER
jgi:Txe/YoeB family toxin of Txe-Axe toxin-antitoxin module